MAEPDIYTSTDDLIRRSNEIKVLLRKLTFNSTGVYKCEVSADSPHFHTYEDQSVMVVVELPEQGPTIHGGRSHYRVGDVARLNCTSSKSKPAAQLTWFINEEKVSSPHLVEYYPWVHHDGLESRRLGLSFTVDKSHFLKGDLVLKCQATVAAIYTAIKEEDAIVSEGDPLILEQREQRILVRSAGSTVLPTSTVSVVLAILMGCQAVT
nr:cell adhesion molecule 2-like [Procambarus clarkii]